MIDNNSRCARKQWLLALGATALVACSSGSKVNQEQVDGAFTSFLIGVQQIENYTGLDKTRGAVDTQTNPPSYDVTYTGCVDGAFGGTLCVQDGTQHIGILPGDIHVIEGLKQTYVFADYANDQAYTFSGTVAIDVAVAIDGDAQTTAIAGTGVGTLTASGALSGELAIDVAIAGGRNYTQDTTTLITVEGTAAHDNASFPVAGAFARE